MTIYSKKMKTTRRRDCIFLGGDFNWQEKEEQEIGKRRVRFLQKQAEKFSVYCYLWCG
jgi:hypothetical protein